MLADDVIDAFCATMMDSRANDVGELLQVIGVAPDEVDRVIQLADFFVRFRELAGSAGGELARAAWLDGFTLGALTTLARPDSETGRRRAR